MASVRDLKKDINYVLGDIIEAVYLVEAANGKQDSKEGVKVIDGAIATFDDLIAKVNKRGVENKKEHYNSVKAELETKAKGLIDDLNKLS